MAKILRVPLLTIAPLLRSVSSNNALTLIQTTHYNNLMITAILMLTVPRVQYVYLSCALTVRLLILAEKRNILALNALHMPNVLPGLLVFLRSASIQIC